MSGRKAAARRSACWRCPRRHTAPSRATSRRRKIRISRNGSRRGAAAFTRAVRFTATRSHSRSDEPESARRTRFPRTTANVSSCGRRAWRRASSEAASGAILRAAACGSPIAEARFVVQGARCSVGTRRAFQCIIAPASRHSLVGTHGCQTDEGAGEGFEVNEHIVFQITDVEEGEVPEGELRELFGSYRPKYLKIGCTTRSKMLPGSACLHNP